LPYTNYEHIMLIRMISQAKLIL